MSSEDRMRMFAANKEKVEAEFRAAVRRGIVDPVVFIIDPRERIGRLIAVSQSNARKVDAMISASTQRGVNPFAIVSCSRKTAGSILDGCVPSSAIEVTKYPTEFAVVVASDEVSITVVQAPGC